MKERQRENPTWELFHRDFIITWQVPQTLATSPTKSPASILSSTSAQMRLTTRRSTQRQQVRLQRLRWERQPRSLSPHQKRIASDVPSHRLVFRSLGLRRVLFFIYLFHPPTPALLLSPGAAEAQLFTLRAAKALAMTVVDVVCRPALLQGVREDFRLARLRAGGETSGEQQRSSGPTGQR